MEYTRHSSQPATVDLVRADLAEFWTIDGSEIQSPQRLRSVSVVSDMLDLEFLPTPGLRPSKATKKDPLPDILGDLLELSPNPKRGRSGRQGKSASDNEFSKQDQYETAPGGQPRKRYTRDLVRVGRLSGPATHSPDLAKLDSPPQKPGHFSHLKLPLPKANKRKRPDQSAAATESPVNSAQPQTRPQRQSIATTTVSSAKQKRLAQVSKQPKTLTEVTNSVLIQTKLKGRNHDDDPFELSDTTDTEAASRPKKRQARKPLPSEPLARSVRKAQVDKGGDFTVSQKSKVTRAPKKPSSRVAPRKKKAEAELMVLETAVHADEGEKLNNPPCQHEGESTFAVTKSKSNEQPRMDHLVLVTKRADTLGMFASPEPQKTSPIAMGQSHPVHPLPSKPRDVIILSSESPEPTDALARSTSPMFVEQIHKHVAASVAPAIRVSVNTESDDQRAVASVVSAINLSVNSESSSQRSPIRLSTTRECLGFTPPPSTQPRTLHNNTKIPQRHNTDHALPTKIRDAFFSDEQPTAVLPPPASELGFCSEEESLSPEEVWKQAVEDDSPPAVLHRIVSLLHRSLKPREEIVRDIAADYRENALRLLDNLSARHGQEKSNMLVAIRKTSRDAFSVFSSAGQDVALLINGLRDMDVAHTADALTRPVLADKLDVVAGLFQTRLSNYARSGPFEDDVSESGDNLDVLAETYRLKLDDATRRPDERAPGILSEVDSQVDEFIQRCLDGETRKARHTETKKPERRSARNADEALEVFLDGVLNKLGKDKAGSISDKGAARNVDDVVSEGSVMADIDFSG